MRKAAAILFLFALSFQFFIKIGAVGYYCLNRVYVANTLCVNREKPQLRCNGKCFLASKLKNVEETQAPMKSSFLLRYEPVEFITNLLPLLKDVKPFTRPTILLTAYPFFYTYCKPASIFHPPKPLAA